MDLLYNLVLCASMRTGECINHSCCPQLGRTRQARIALRIIFRMKDADEPMPA